MLTSVVTGVSALAAVMEPFASACGTVGKAHKSLFSICGCASVAGPVTSLLANGIKAIKARFQRIFLTRYKARLNAQLKQQKEKDLELATPAAVLEITHRGKFLKRGRLHNTYRRRYMVLENGVLRYFKERDTKVCP